MKTDAMERGERYYTLVGQKNVEGVAGFLHPEVEFDSPLAALKGKEAVVAATTNFMNGISALRIRAKFGGEECAMIVYDVDISGVANNFPGASMLQFRDGLIVRIELFFDGGRVLPKKEEVFS